MDRSRLISCWLIPCTAAGDSCNLLHGVLVCPDIHHDLGNHGDDFYLHGSNSAGGHDLPRDLPASFGCHGCHGCHYVH